jgi:hypothetical protein
MQFVGTDQLCPALELLPRELQPQLRGLVDGREQQLVTVDALVCGLLLRQQLIGAQIPLVVRCAVAREDRVRSGRGDLTVTHAGDNTYVGWER